ncbi:MAG: hypothetical protein GY875_24540 [Gammaproteobacteria bacterium]|nr:hypothetical protein [Gammaproteobacteria bacterium]
MNRYINDKLGFYFDGGFEQMISEAQLDEDEIMKWGSLAVLFDYCIEDASSLSSKEKKDAFCLIEALYTKFEVDIMFDDKFDDSIDGVGEGYDFDLSQFGDVIEKAVQLVEENGISLYRLI